ncbi:protein phosphatase 1 regulatory subunit 3C [Microplitis mediator]|uniref:protein phosphatase 1 regulatory subunit 3C n=1 Tax=Microplitis mediator TaxID=375433 RepID=UPI0025578375|nr:protein phosphatase 1 regulatory subunit 3C [Microplitis mediator]
MCSIAMPSELMGHSPPVYGHHHFLYNPLMVTAASTPATRGTKIRPCITTTIDGLSSGITINFNKNNSSNLNNSTNNSNNINNNNSNNNSVINNSSNGSGVECKQKKRVVFADDRGRPLTQVRVMSEPSNMPPALWTNAYLSKVTRDMQAETTTNPWIAHFQQPASDYLAFRHKLDQNSVSLENVIIRESEQCIDGTIKVKNLAYDKEVVVRTSCDNWQTHEDVYCTYVPQHGTNAIQPKLILYDTFKFRVTLPVTSDKIEFCVCYRVDGQEYWDNNDEKNYVIKKRPECRRYSSSSQMDLKTSVSYKNIYNTIDTNNNTNNHNNNGVMKADEAVRANIFTWSEFASWQHLNNEAPYW